MIEVVEEHKKFLSGAAITLLVVLSLYFAMKFLSELKDYGMAGGGNANTITLSGYGEVTAVPDIANVHFTIEKKAQTVAQAQEAVAAVEGEVLEYLRANGIEEKDMKTTDASFYPEYEFQYDTGALAPCTELGCPPRPGRNVVVGYVATESIIVKIRNTDDVGKIMEGLGTLGATNLSGPDFAIDDEDALKVEARKKAIEDARTKAKALAKDLDVRLGRVVTFSESDYGFPIYAVAMEARGGGVDEKATPAEIPKGENIISSNVTITYEIR